jgi:uncharacterized protein YecE (DUF72 family)
MAQLRLFGDSEPPERGGGPGGAHRAVAPAALGEEPRALAARLPPLVKLGTSSWSFPGWQGLVYRDQHSEQVLARRGLPAYAAHPLLGGVGLDRTFYAPLPAETLAGYAADVPAGFRFLVKAHEALTLARYPQHARYGAQRGLLNPLLFDVAWARDQVVGPFVDGLADKGGALLFQFAPQSFELLANAPSARRDKSAPRVFAERLYRFLRDLPSGPSYAVEVRNADLLTPDFAACLKSAGVSPCLGLLPGMPPVDPLAELTGAADANMLVVRWLLAPHHDYTTARAAYQPFNALVDPDPGARAAIARMIARAVMRGQPAIVIANNKAEGSSPLTVEALARAVVEALPPNTATDPHGLTADAARR